MHKGFLDIKVGDKVIVFDEYSHDYEEHILEVNSIEYDTYADEFRREVERDREEQRLARQAGLTTGFRPSVSREAIDRTSSVVCKALYYGYGEEMYSKRDIAQHLGIAQKHVDKFLAEVSAWSR